MQNVLVNGLTNITIDSNNVTNEQLYIATKGRDKSSLVVTLQGDNPLHLEVKGDISADSNINVLYINHCGNTVVTDEKYQLANDCNAVVAYMQLAENDLELNAEYNLVGQGANLKVQGASLTASVKKINIDCNHYAPNTTANVDNLGVVMGKGRCEMVIRNKVEKNIRNCETHQTSRILTYDKTAVGKILPVLYIDNNEVAASHAASLGQPDESQIFYLTSRGLSREEALQLITIGYLLPVTTVIEDENLNEILKNEIEMKVAERCMM